MRFQLGVTSGRHIDWLRIAAHRNRHSLGVERILRDQLLGFLVRLGHRDRRRVLVRRRYLVILVLVGHVRRACVQTCDHESSQREQRNDDHHKGNETKRIPPAWRWHRRRWTVLRHSAAEGVVARKREEGIALVVATRRCACLPPRAWTITA